MKILNGRYLAKKLKRGNKILLEAKVIETDRSKSPLKLSFDSTNYGRGDVWFSGDANFTVVEPPQVEKVEVPDWFDQWYKKLIVDCSYYESKALVLINQCGDGHVLENFDGGIFGGTAKNSVIYTGWINSNRELASRAILDGYTAKPKQWVVKSKDHIGLESFVNGTVNPMWTTEEPLWMTFTEKSKAEAVATLIEGSVEEV